MSIDYWIATALDKVFPDSFPPPRAAVRADLTAARGETEDFQVAIRIPKGVTVRRASWSATDLVGPRGARLSSECVEAHWEWCIHVTHEPFHRCFPENADPAHWLRRAPALFPDAFLEAPAIGIRDEWTQPLWVSVRVPHDARPGIYEGHLGLALEIRNVPIERAEIPLRVRVRPYALPARPTLRHTEWMFPSLVADYYRLERWSESHWRWIERIAADMGRHRQDMILTPFGELVEARRDRHGRMQFDFTRLDRWVRLFRAAGVDWIEGGHVGRHGGDPVFAWNRIPIRDARGRPLDVSPAALSEEAYAPLLGEFLRGVHAHLRARGWADRTVQHFGDEPSKRNFDSWKQHAARLREWLPDVSIIDAAPPEDLDGFIDIRVSQIQHFMPGWRRRANEQAWCYVCMEPQAPFPNRFLNQASIRNRIQFWLAWSLGLKGFLHWGYAYWKPHLPVAIELSPWTDSTGLSAIFEEGRGPWPPGDPHIVYPGRDSICSSLRWEVVRKGMEDHATLSLLEQAVESAGRREAAAARRGRTLLNRIRGTIAPDPRNYTRDDALLLAAREAAGHALEHLI
ncbi:MAG: DUF4091 domain-containing protein [Lentisphaerae bacterium]|nr:DUF4091 domain-containing protein [Lentisphaerota bacterium]